MSAPTYPAPHEFCRWDSECELWVSDFRAVRDAHPDYASVDSGIGSWEWYLKASGSIPSGLGPFDVRCDDDHGLLMATVYGSVYSAGHAAARVYYELFDGQHDEDTIQGLWLRIATGGKEALWSESTWRYSIYGRDHLSGPNLKVLRSASVRRYGPAAAERATWPMWDWRDIYLPIKKTDGIRCIVVRLECAQNDVVHGIQQGTDEEGPFGGNCPYGVRIKAARVYASDLGRKVTYAGALSDIVAPYYPDPVFPSSKVKLGQLAFPEIPNDRWEALDDIIEMCGWDYGVWDDDELIFRDPEKAPRISVPIRHAGVQRSSGPDDSQARNAVRVKYTNANGKPREVIEHSRLKLGGDVVSETIEAPASVRTKEGARRVARRWLRSRRKIHDTGDLTVTGTGPWGDALHLRPTVKVGRENVIHVQLRPLEWSATLQFGVEEDTFAAWWARRDAKAKAR